MFDLNREIDQWCRSVLDAGCSRRQDLDELIDHLHCMVEERTAAGISEQAAFVDAIKQMGDSELITAGYAGNRNLLQKMAAYDRNLQQRISQRFSARQLTVFMIAYSLLCAAAMIFLPERLTTLDADTVFNWILVIWFIPFVTVASLPEVRRAECALFRRWFGRKEAR